MKQSILIHSIVIALTLPLAAVAQDKNDPGKNGDAVKNPPAVAPGRPGEPLRTPDSPTAQRQFAGTVTAVSRDDKTITINDTTKGAHKLRIGEATKIMRGDKAATWDDLKVGAKVEGTCIGGTDEARAETVNING